MHSSLASSAQEVVEEFAYFDDWLDRYEYLIELGRDLPLIDGAYKTDEYRIKGCQSQVWLRAVSRDGSVFFTADSDALITKGLIALLVRVLNGRPADQIAEADLSFLDEIGMKDHLSSTRKNGLNAMVNRIREYASSIGDSSSGVDTATPDAPDSALGTDDLEGRIVEALQTVFDPELPVNVFDLGLIYDIQINPDRTVHITMTLTTPNCPAAAILPAQVETCAGNVPGVAEARVEITFDPPYSIERMTDAAKLELGFL